MAQKQYDNDLSMDNYFNQRLAENTEPNNPFEVAEAEPQRSKRPKSGSSGKKRAKNARLRRFQITAGAILLLILIICIIIFVNVRRNDGARYARLLSQGIGSSVSTAEKNAKITLNPESGYVTLNQLYVSYQSIAESKKTCKIQGVRLPEWAIFCNTDAEELVNVTYYNYEILEKNVFGTERKSYLDPNLVSPGADVAHVEKQLDLEPYRIQYLQSKLQIREYRYCYEDKESGDIVAYVITAVWDENNALQKIEDTRKNYIGTLLSSPEMKPAQTTAPTLN